MSDKFLKMHQRANLSHSFFIDFVLCRQNNLLKINISLYFYEINPSDGINKSSKFCLDFILEKKSLFTKYYHLIPTSFGFWF